MGVAPRRLDGWEPRRLVEYVRDDDGVVVGEMVTTEPEWDAHQRGLMFAHLRSKADMGAHGQPMSEATSPLADPSRWDAKWRYEGIGPYTDYAQKAQDDRKEAYRQSLPKGTPMPNGLRFGVVKREL